MRSVTSGSLLRQLEAASGLLALVQIPGAGRGLIAASDIPQGTVIHTEAPMLAIAAASTTGDACSTCLRPLPTGFAAAEDGGNRFCSESCSTTAQQEWLQVENRCDLSALHRACAASGEKFPLLAARLACMRLQRAERRASEFSDQISAGEVPRGDALQDMGQLCHAKIFEPPDDWAAMHALLLQGLRPLGAPLDQLDLHWYCWVLSRLHLNVFRVDVVPLLGLHTDPAAMLRAASAAVAGGAGAHRRSGSAVYLLASMFNHSCEPNVDVTFPRNNAVASFVAALDIGRHTELSISYIDTELGVEARRRQLQFAYGFTCPCVRCREE